MGKESETVRSSTDRGLTDPLYRKQRADVSNMRAALLACSGDPTLTTTALKQIAVMRVYHQVARIIKYLDLMDKLEEKLYESIEYTIDTADPTRTSTWIQLLGIQEKLQKSMIESHNLLQPYLTLKTYEIMDLMPQNSQSDEGVEVISAKTRESVRSKAQVVLKELEEAAQEEEE